MFMIKSYLKKGKFKMKSSFICFIGVDGSGKTTHAKFLKEYLEKQGYQCKYVWGAYRLFFSYVFFITTKLLGYWKNTKNDVYTDPLEYAPKLNKKNLASIYHLFIFLDYQIIVTIKIRIPIAMGKIVICDRYIYDILMELQLSNNLSEKFFYFLIRSMPQPDITFLMNVKEDIAMHRRGFTKDFFLKRKIFLMNLSKVIEVTVVDSSKDLLKNQELIRNKTISVLN